MLFCQKSFAKEKPSKLMSNKDTHLIPSLECSILLGQVSVTTLDRPC